MAGVRIRETSGAREWRAARRASAAHRKRRHSWPSPAANPTPIATFDTSLASVFSASPPTHYNVASTPNNKPTSLLPTSSKALRALRARVNGVPGNACFETLYISKMIFEVNITTSETTTKLQKKKIKITDLK
jgi:hypothetical protein